MAKPNRNDPCPCGSGEKFKKCCIDVPGLFRNWPETEGPIDKMLPTFLTKHDSIDLIKSFSALSILPENHGKNIRLELAAIHALHAFNTSPKQPSKSDLEAFMNEDYSSHYLEDPPTNLFTDLISYHGGDYLIFPGITETGSFILANLLTAINHWPDTELPKQFKTNCHHGIMFILSISDAIASSMGYTRYQNGKPNKEPIEFPSDGLFDHSRRAVEFSREQMENLLRERGIAPEVVSRFTLDRSAIDFNNLSIEDSPVMQRPILETASGYLVVSPTALSIALTNFIWEEASSFDCTETVEDAYNNVVWNDGQLQLKNMGFDLIKVDEITSLVSQWENLYRFDTDKVALIRLIAPSRVSGSSDKRIPAETLIGKLKEITAFKDHQYLEISLISGNGQVIMHAINHNAHAKVLPIQLHEFNVLSDLDLADAIDLWNFANAIEEQAPQGILNNFSFLDTFKLYKEKDDSFYISDEANNHLIRVHPGYSSEYVFKAKQKRDVHSIKIKENERVLRIPVVRKDRYLPIYCNPNDLLGNVLRFAVEGFHQPIWVMPNFDLANVHGEFRNTLFELTNTVAFWLTQICSELRDHLKQLGSTPISIRFDLESIEKFENVTRDFKRDPNLLEKFKWSASKSGIVIQLPSELTSYFYGSDNEGERVLVKSLLLAFNELLQVNSLVAIPADQVDAIVESSAPLGMKKKILLLDSGDNLLLDQTNLIEERRIREYNVSVVLNSIVPGLGDKVPAVGELRTKQEKEKLTRDIVMRSLLPSLRKAIGQYDCEELLSYLIELNEALIQRREFYKVNTPSRIACYVSVEQHGIDWLKSSSEINRTTLALRCLMEHVTAEQPRGTKRISITGVDEL
ncbi:MAG TPA: SEC-C metal-binding domain-containing protein, partial [Cyclobacteriaceae bacterium]|nr:SEC-C metal-binding domain-containing protein [Cyclobacteriaceae bacterium]